MTEVKEVKEKMVQFIRIKGPSLPIQIAKEMKMNSLFISAFLSELVDEKRVKVSSLKVGGSPLYFLEGQEKELEKFYNYLHPKEAEAFQILKEKKILKDSEQEPAIRVALRAIKDFSAGFSRNNEIYWRYLQIPEQEVLNIIENRHSLKPPEIKEEIKIEEKIIIQEPKQIEIKEEKKEESKTEVKKPRLKIKPPEKKQEISEFQNPLAFKPVEKQKKEKPKSEFVMKVIEFLKDNHFRLIEEKEHKAKEYLCIAQISTILGPIDFITEAKDKKTISDADLQKFLSYAQTIPLPALVLYTGELTKKAQEYLEKYSSILKTKRIG
jgi:hypothetical protein